jgi:hypothetical protein
VGEITDVSDADNLSNARKLVGELNFDFTPRDVRMEEEVELLGGSSPEV